MHHSLIYLSQLEYNVSPLLYMQHIKHHYNYNQPSIATHTWFVACILQCKHSYMVYCAAIPYIWKMISPGATTDIVLPLVTLHYIRWVYYYTRHIHMGLYYNINFIIAPWWVCVNHVWYMPLTTFILLFCALTTTDKHFYAISNTP